MTEPHPFRRAAEAKDLDLLTETLREDVVLHSPILFRGFEGREIVSQILTHVAATLEDLTYTDELAGERTVALRFKAHVEDRELEGIDFLEKVNVVLMRGINDDEIVDFATFGRERGVQVRFIEFMPLDADGAWRAEQVISRDEIVAAIGAVYPLEAIIRDHHPAELYRYSDGAGEIGIIPTVTDAFCGSCDRVRLTAEGGLRNCLFALEEEDLRGLLRGGGSDDDLAAAVAANIGAKWAGHQINQVHFIRPARSMSQIGG